MIIIKENISEKLPGITSLFIDTNSFYNKDVFNTLIQIQDCFYIKTESNTVLIVSILTTDSFRPPAFSPTMSIKLLHSKKRSVPQRYADITVTIQY